MVSNFIANNPASVSQGHGSWDSGFRHATVARHYPTRAVVLCAEALFVLVIMATFACTSTRQDMEGTVGLLSGNSREPYGHACSPWTLSIYPDGVMTGASVVVSDERGTVLGLGTLGSGTWRQRAAA